MDFTSEACMLSNLTWYTIRSWMGYLHPAWQVAITFDVGEAIKNVQNLLMLSYNSQVVILVKSLDLTY